MYKKDTHTHTHRNWPTGRCAGRGSHTHVSNLQLGPSPPFAFSVRFLSKFKVKVYNVGVAWHAFGIDSDDLRYGT